MQITLEIGMTDLYLETAIAELCSASEQLREIVIGEVKI